MAALHAAASFARHISRVAVPPAAGSRPGPPTKNRILYWLVLLFTRFCHLARSSLLRSAFALHPSFRLAPPPPDPRVVPHSSRPGSAHPTARCSLLSSRSCPAHLLHSCPASFLASATLPTRVTSPLARSPAAPALLPAAPTLLPAAPPPPRPTLLVVLASPLRPARCPRPTPDTPASCPAVPARYPTLPPAAPPPPPHPTRGAYVPAAPRPLPPPDDRHSRQLPRHSHPLSRRPRPSLLVLLASPLCPARCPRPMTDTPASCPAVPTRCPAAPAPAYSCCLRPPCAPPAAPARRPTLPPAALPFPPVSPLPTPRRPSTPDAPARCPAAHRPMPAPRPLLAPPFVLGVLSHFLLAMPPPFWLLPLLAPVRHSCSFAYDCCLTLLLLHDRQFL
ncbi:hypothetical protein B0H11DRAFT_2204800 [Mycena galericulata]|nr:hypothetical protein B0H11DRAFT_2204800 [Mycena galericulata]